jgi:hypothetical protein
MSDYVDQTDDMENDMDWEQIDKETAEWWESLPVETRIDMQETLLTFNLSELSRELALSKLEQLRLEQAAGARE